MSNPEYHTNRVDKYHAIDAVEVRDAGAVLQGRLHGDAELVWAAVDSYLLYHLLEDTYDTVCALVVTLCEHNGVEPDRWEGDNGIVGNTGDVHIYRSLMRIMEKDRDAGMAAVAAFKLAFT